MTGAPLLQCKNILTECQGDLDKAKAVLREKNLIFAEKKAGADAKEGVAFIDEALGLRRQPDQKERGADQPEL
jgi:translation elongation factor EF-Ts